METYSFKIKYTILLLICFFVKEQANAQKVTDKNDYTSLYFFNPQKKGFEVSISGVFMFTSGVKNFDGFRLGAGLNLSQDIGDFKLSTGIDFYKAKQRFGIGTTYAGAGYNDGRHGGTYYVNKYFQGDKQISGLIALDLGDWQIRFEDDILAILFTRFVVYDRYRTAALEVRYKHFLFGGNVYSNESNGLLDVSPKNRKGIYYSGKQTSSPIYIGYTDKNLIARYGINTKFGGFLMQNWWHRFFFETSDFTYGTYKSQFLQLGIDKPYTLY